MDDVKAEYVGEVRQIIQKFKEGFSAAATSAGAVSAAGAPGGVEESKQQDAASAGAAAAGAEGPQQHQADGHAEQKQFRSFDLNEECSSWFLLARQAVVDVMFLDRSQLECQAKLHNSTSTTTVSAGEWNKTYVRYVFRYMVDMLKYCYSSLLTHFYNLHFQVMQLASLSSLLWYCRRTVM